MKILVIGGAGLIGSHLCRFLVNTGHTVICDDDGLHDNNIVDLVPNPNFIRLGRNQLSWFNYKGDLGIVPDQIYNLASPTAPGHFKENPIKTILTNVQVTHEALELARKHNIPVLHASTVRVLEEVDTFSDNSCYINGKRVAETLCYEYRKQGVDVKVLRMYNVYGTGMRHDDSRVIPTFVRQAISGDDLTVWGGGQKDSFTYVADLIPVLVELMNDTLWYSENWKPMTIGSNEFISIHSLAKLIVEVTGSSSFIRRIEGKDTFRTFSEVKIKVNSNLREGLRRMVNGLQ